MMKKTMNLYKNLILLALIVFFVFLTNTSVYASQVTIIVPNQQEQTTSSIQPAEGQELFPVSVTETFDERGRNIIIKRYELAPFELPRYIPRDDFTLGNRNFTLSNILRSTNQNIDLKTITEIVEKSSPNNRWDNIVNLFPPYIEWEDENGQFTGTLTLDINSITVEESGRQTTNNTQTVTRRYPHLPNRDTALIPRTVVDGGVTHHLVDVRWEDASSTEIDHTNIGNSFTAIASYSATVSQTRITGFIAKAEYTGEVGFTNTDISVFEAIFVEVYEQSTTEDNILDLLQFLMTEQEETLTIEEISFEELLELVNSSDETIENSEDIIDESIDLHVIMLWLLGLLLVIFLITFLALSIYERQKKYKNKIIIPKGENNHEQF